MTPRSGHMTVSSPEGGSGQVGSMDTASTTKAAHVPWRPVGTSLISAGVPTAIGMVHPFIGVGMAIVELALALTVIGTALFGSPELSERAFRLLRWIANRPEPASPAERLDHEKCPKAGPGNAVPSVVRGSSRWPAAIVSAPRGRAHPGCGRGRRGARGSAAALSG